MAHSREISKKSIKGNELIKTLSKIADCSSDTIYSTVSVLAIQQYLKTLSPEKLRKIGEMAFTIRMNKLKVGLK